MGGRGRNGLRTARIVRSSPMEARRQIRVHNPEDDEERLVREVIGPTVKKIL